MKRLKERLRQINGRGYPSYKSLKGGYDFPSFRLEVVHVQGDPFAAPSRVAVRVRLRNLPHLDLDQRNRSQRIGLEDGILRSVKQVLRSVGRQRGSGKSGDWGMVRLGQEILPRTGCEAGEDDVVVRLTMGLPAAGRRILGREAETMFLSELPQIVDEAILKGDPELWVAHARASEDQDFLRNILAEKHWIAFVGEGALLPRASGIDDRPLPKGGQPWVSPPELQIEVDLPHQGRISGTAIPEGVTLICGGGFHGKSTLLSALAQSVFNHIPGDGRETCVTTYDAVAIRAEDGRSVSDVDISSFIGELPGGRSTVRFSTENASGSTSQAANIVEAVEMGARCLVIDEDTSATNFMVRDRRMQELVEKNQEPIVPFIDRVREIHQELGISTIVVVGGSGDYFEVADQVLVLEEYRPNLATEQAKSIAGEHPSHRKREKVPPLKFDGNRVPEPKGFDPRRGHRSEKVQTRETRSILFGRQEIDVSLVSQLTDYGQTKVIGDWMIRCSRGMADGDRSMQEICLELEQDAMAKPLSQTIPGSEGDRVFARRFELAATINRLRTLKIR